MGSRKNPLRARRRRRGHECGDVLALASARAACPLPRPLHPSALASNTTDAPVAARSRPKLRHVDDQVPIAEERCRARSPRPSWRFPPTAPFPRRPPSPPACDPLPLLHVDRAARAAGRHEQIGLPGEEGWNLEGRPPPLPRRRPPPSWISVSTGQAAHGPHPLRSPSSSPGPPCFTTRARLALLKVALKQTGSPRCLSQPRERFGHSRGGHLRARRHRPPR